MAKRFRVAVIGVGRIGAFHARHVQELASERGDCALTAVVDGYGDLAAEVDGSATGRSRDGDWCFQRRGRTGRG